MEKHLKSWSFTYSFFKMFIRAAHNLFYRRIVVEGKRNVPRNKAVIIAPNHQNSLMDPMAVINTLDHQPVFLARADIFKSKFVARILNVLKILPVYRIRDGAEQLKKNEEIFNLSIKILENNQTLSLFPEAAHNGRRQFLPLKKAVQRIAFLSEARNNWQLGLQVIPTGINYTNYFTPGEVLHIKYGQPILVSDFKDIYLENENKAFHAFSEELNKRLDELAINIRSKAHYTEHDTLRTMFDYNVHRKFAKGLFSVKNKFIAQRTLIKALDKAEQANDNQYESLLNKFENYSNILKTNKLSDHSFKIRNYGINTILRSLILFLGFPIFIYGTINNFIAYKIPVWFNEIKVKDPQFHSSLRFGFGIFLFPIFWALQTTIFAYIPLFAGLKWWYLLSLPLTGYLAYYYYRFFLIFRVDIRFYFFSLKNLKKVREIHILRKEIKEIVIQLVTKYDFKKISLD